MERDYEKDANLDKFDLAGEWDRHVNICDYYNREYALAVEELQKAEGDLYISKKDDSIKKIRAKLWIDITKYPRKYGIECKPTKDVIESVILVNPEYCKTLKEYGEEYKKANDRYAKARKDEKILKHAYDTVIWHRRDTFNIYELKRVFPLMKQKQKGLIK